MAIDVGIYNQLLRPAKSVAEYDDEALKNKQNRLAVQMQQTQFDDRSRAIADGNKLRQVVSSFGADQTANYNALLSAGRLDEAQKYIKSNADVGKVNADTAESAAKTKETHLKAVNLKLGQAKDLVNTIQTPEQAALWVQQMYKDPDLSQVFAASGDTPEAAIKRIPTDPKAFAEWKMQASLGADKLIEYTKPTANTVANNATQVQTTSMNNATSVRTANISAGASRYSADTNARSAEKRLQFEKDKEDGGGTGDLSDATVDAIGQGRMKAPTGYALRNPKMANLMDRVAAKYPDYDATEYDAKQKAMRDAATGPLGNSIRSFAVATDHLGQLKGLITALDNGNTPLINKYGNIVAQQTGSVAPTNFDAAKGIVAKEVLKSIVAGGGGVEERLELERLMNSAKTTKQLNGVVDTYLHLMSAQKDGLEKQYELSTGRKDAKTRFKYTSDAPSDASSVPSDIDALLKKHGGK